MTASGAIAETLGLFFTPDGEIVDTPISRRTLAVDTANLTSAQIIRSSGGLSTFEATCAVPKAGLVRGLIIDSASARQHLGNTKKREGQGLAPASPQSLSLIDEPAPALRDRSLAGT